MLENKEFYKYNENNKEKIIKEIKKVIILIAIVHLIYFFIFMLFKVSTLAITNSISLLAYILLMKNFKIEKFKLISNGILCEVIIHIILCGIVVGEGINFSVFCLIILVGFATVSYFYNRISDEKIDIFKYTIIISIIYISLALYGEKYALKYIHRDSNLIELLDRINSIIAILALNWYIFIIFKESTRYENELNEKNKLLHNMSYTDPLTLLYNRRAIYKYVDEYCREGNKYSIILCDIDNFKMINDKYGHICGDLVIKEIANTIKNEIQNKGYVARWGGEEILVLFDGSIKEAFQISERIRKNISSNIKEYNNNYIPVTITIGIGNSIEEGISFKEAIEDADRKLYIGKRKGKNTVVK